MSTLEQQVHFMKQEADATVARINNAKAVLCPEAFQAFVEAVRNALPLPTTNPRFHGKGKGK